MKRLFVLCLLSALPLLSYAGSFDIVLNGGIVKNTAPVDYTWGIIKGGNASPAGTFRLLYNIDKNWQVGMSIGYVPLTYTGTASPLYFYNNGIVPQSSMVGTTRYRDYLANPAIPVLVEANHNFSLGRFEIYSGISAGMFTVFDWQKRSYEGYFGPYGIRGGLMGGMQAGGNWFFTKWCGLNFQMSVQYYEPYELMAFPVTAGFRFRIPT